MSCFTRIDQVQETRQIDAELARATNEQGVMRPVDVTKLIQDNTRLIQQYEKRGYIVTETEGKVVISLSPPKNAY